MGDALSESALARGASSSTRSMSDALSESALSRHAIAQEQDLERRSRRVQQDRRRRGRDRDARRHQVRGAHSRESYGPLGRRVRHHRLRGRDEGRLRQQRHGQRRAGLDGLRGLLRGFRGRARVGHGRAGHRQVGQKGRRRDDADGDGLPASRYLFLGRARARLRAAGRHRQGVLPVSVDARPTLTRRCPHRPSRSPLRWAMASRLRTSTPARTRTWVRWSKISHCYTSSLGCGLRNGTRRTNGGGPRPRPSGTRSTDTCPRRRTRRPGR